MNGAVAWFAKNRKVDANGMAVNLRDLGIEDLYYVRYDGKNDFTKVNGNTFTFVDVAPGDTVTIKAIYLSDSDDERKLDILFKDMGGGEAPLVKDGKYYYFGTQLKVTQKAINGGTAEDVNKFLVDPPENKIFNTSQLDAPANNFILAEGLEAVAPAEIELGVDLGIDLTGKKVRMLEFTVEFVNYTDIDQNDYQHFGKGSEKCVRQLVAYVIE